MGARRRAVNNQSPGLAESAMESYRAQLNQATPQRKATKKRLADPEDVLVYEILKKRGDEQAHHKNILETLDVLYRGLDDAEAAELTAHLQQFGPTGNNILNLLNMPQDVHQGGIHPFTKAMGYEYHGRAKNPTGFALDIQEASEMPLAYRKHVGEQYMTKAVPAMNDKINDLLTDHPSMQEPLDMSAVREAQAMKDLYQAELMKEVGAGDLRNYDNLVRQNGGDDRQVTINADTVILEKAINGNGKKRK